MPILLQPENFIRMPWKNGQGRTTEFFRIGEDFRVSSAEVNGDAAFSRYPDHQRWIAQLSGPQMTLRHDNGTAKILRPYEPYSFDGAMATHCQLAGGDAAKDFNVFCRKDVYHAELSAAFHSRSVNVSSSAFILCAVGECEIQRVRVTTGSAWLDQENARKTLDIQALTSPFVGLIVCFSRI